MFNSVDRADFEAKIGWVFRYSASQLLTELRTILEKYGYQNIVEGKEFIYGAGSIPVLMVAHVDTVHHNLVSNIVYDPFNQVLWSPEGIGADDRAGVLGILKLLERGHRPHILFTDGEESGGSGARAATNELFLPDVRFAIELDRRNGTEAVFYQCFNKNFEDYILNFGFKRATGSFSDISILCPAWEIAGVNLSCGYYNAHSTTEYLSLPELEVVILNIEKLFQEIPTETFVYSTAPKVAPVVTVTYPITRTFNTDYKYKGTGYDVYGGYGSYDASDYWLPGDIDFRISPSTLVDLYGKDYAYWNKFLRDNHKDLVAYAEDAALTAIDEFAYEHSLTKDYLEDDIELDDIELDDIKQVVIIDGETYSGNVDAECGVPDDNIGNKKLTLVK